MAQKIENHQPAAAFQNPVRRRDGLLRMNGVMQRLTQNRKIDAVFRDRRIFDVAKPVFEILESVFFASCDPNSTIFGELSMAMTLRAFFASNCESVPSPAPRSATVSGGSKVMSVCASAFHERPGT